MANTIKIRRSAVQGAVPTTGQLALGELALNTYDGKLYAKKSVEGVESIVELSGGSGTGGGSGGSTYSFSSSPPVSPSPGDLWTDSDDGTTYLRVGDATSYQWVEIGGGGGGGGSTNYVYSSAEPVAPVVGDIWTDAGSGVTYYYLEDEDGFQWVELGPSGQRGPVGPKSVTLANPTNSENLILFYADTELSVAQIRSVLIGSSSPSVTFSVRYGSDVSGGGTELVSGGIVCTNTTTVVGTTLFDNGVIPANSFVWLTTSAVSGNVNGLHVTMTFA